MVSLADTADELQSERFLAWTERKVDHYAVIRAVSEQRPGVLHVHRHIDLIALRDEGVLHREENRLFVVDEQEPAGWLRHLRVRGAGGVPPDASTANSEIPEQIVETRAWKTAISVPCLDGRPRLRRGRAARTRRLFVQALDPVQILDEPSESRAALRPTPPASRRNALAVARLRDSRLRYRHKRCIFAAL